RHITAVPKPKKRKRGAEQPGLVFDEGKRLSTDEQAYDATSLINEVRQQVDTWRQLPKSAWGVSAETARLLEHWRSYPFNEIRPFFCQIEAVETAIWLTEVAGDTRLQSGSRILKYLENANAEANPEL